MISGVWTQQVNLINPSNVFCIPHNSFHFSNQCNPFNLTNLCTPSNPYDHCNISNPSNPSQFL